MPAISSVSVHEFLSPKKKKLVGELLKGYILGIGNSLKLIQDIKEIKVNIAAKYKALTSEYFQNPFRTTQDR